jgi:methylphosphotriester-DNA--protein-cysteine methyltransferase
MSKHQDLFLKEFAGRRQLAVLINTKQVILAGNRTLKLFGTLPCASGKRMKAVNRIFFANEAAAVAFGYRPCAHCMQSEYRLWKENK